MKANFKANELQKLTEINRVMSKNKADEMPILL